MSAMFKRKDPSKLQSQLNSFQSKGFQESDDTAWKLEVDKSGNGSAVIRFLPGRTEDDNPFVKIINHGFRINGKWYIENCPSTHNDFDGCPVCAYIKEHDLYNTDNDKYGLVKRKMSYWSNVLIIKDSANPANEGKIFKYRFGKKIMDKIQAMIAVDEDIGEEPVDVTCVFDGANFHLKAKKVGDHLNYDDSKFLKASPIDNIDDESFQESLISGMHDINAIAKPDQFKDFATLKTAFDKVIGTARQSRAVDDFDKEMTNFKAQEAKPVPAQSATPVDSTDVDEELKALLGDM
ncbi:MAG: hypothetical protein [Caudoviricetes sp.]|nr:MAG: hypothetical protein [Caudoviricetes sp.]